jgi:hypothetical protein
MIDYIVGAVLGILIGAAIAYIIREKKKGVACIGCPAAGTCSRKNHPDGEGCSCSIDVKAVEEELRNAVRESHTED